MTNIILAKPTGISLRDHTQHVEEEMAQILRLRPFLLQKYRQRTGQPLEERCLLSAKHHDDGKQDSAWQKACRDDYVIFLDKGKPPYFNAPNLRKAGVRHELASLEIARKKNIALPLIVRAAIAAHHGKFARKYYESSWKTRFAIYWNEFDKHLPITNSDGDPDLKATVAKWYEYAGPRALLQLADHRASAKEDGETLPSLDIDFSYSFPAGWQKRSIQRKIEEVADRQFVLLRAPTGAGKTHTALLWAKHHIAHNRADRLVIAMPTRFTANALSIGVAEQLDTGLYHSTAWFQRLQEQLFPTHQANKLRTQEQVLARKLECPVTVTTIDHLCACLTATREDHHATFFNLAHACVVIDEADFYDSFTQTNIIVLLNVLQMLDVPVLMMSATIPESGLRFYQQHGIQCEEITEVASEQQFLTTTNAPPQKKYHVRHALGDISMLGDISTLSGEASQPISSPFAESLSLLALLHRAKTEPTIIYANTVDRAQQYYAWFRENDVKADEIVLYHSRFTELHKVAKEKRVLSMLGKEAWENGTAHGIAILTQIGEMSVNISTRFMISDICPTDRLTQRLGRSVRFDFQHEQGEIFLVTPLKNNLVYPAPYGKFENKQWISSEAFLTSQQLLLEGEYSPDDLVRIVNQTYPSQPDADGKARENKNKLQHCITHHWLIGPAETPASAEEEDDEYSWAGWQSRDVPTQRTVYVGVPTMLSDDELHTSFKNWQDRKLFDIEHGISMYAYEFHREKKNFIASTLYVRDNAEETVFLVPDRFYSEEQGLYFAQSHNEDA
jgi:CRISPR-associated endonuclease/helicase Cas3